MKPNLSRDRILPETDLPSSASLIAEAKREAGAVVLGRSRFLEAAGVDSEFAFKKREAVAGRTMFHAQVGWRDPDLTAKNISEISQRVFDSGGRVGRYGICLDWSMGYPVDQREGRQRGTGLVLRSDDDFQRIAGASDAAPHFGDFVIGMPAALENTIAALRAGATTIGNLGQYFTFRLPDWDDDVAITAATVKAIKLCALQPVPILIHSNLDDGFAARFSDLACALGAVRIEKYIVGDLLGGHIGHCFGHTFSDLMTRQAFLLALHDLGGDPGTMIYGNTTAFTPNPAESYAALASYLAADIAALRWAPTGHALTSIPVTEAIRIPNIDEIVEAQVFAMRLNERISSILPIAPPQTVRDTADDLIAASHMFFENVMNGLAENGYDTADPFEILLALRRIGAPELERQFGPGPTALETFNGRSPIVATSVVGEISSLANRIVGNLEDDVIEVLSSTKPKVCVATTDVHEYGKRLIDQVLSKLDLVAQDGGVSVDPDDLACAAVEGDADAIAISTYNGVALDFATNLQDQLRKSDRQIPVYIGGRMNEVPDGTNTGLPVDVSTALAKTGAIVCDEVEDMLRHLASIGQKS